jgi:malate synthase
MSDVQGVEILGPITGQFDEILTPEALAFVADLHRLYAPTRRALLAERLVHAQAIAEVGTIDFLAETADIRNDRTWRVAEAPADLRDRRVEITGPTEAKMLINAWNSGARIHLADFEDANAPTWSNLIQGQLNLRDANLGTLTFTSPDGREYALAERTAIPLIRPRGWHLDEAHVMIDGEAVSGALFDFALYFFHNARHLISKGSGPYFYLPKTESHLEARLWNDIFCSAQDALGIPRGTIRATVLIETIHAAYQMQEILYELREHASGLNAGRWDYLFSIIKTFRSAGASFVLPDRNSVTMTAPFMRAYTELLVSTCHQRGAFAIGGMAAFIPSRRDPEANRIAMEKVEADKTREANDGFDGSWVAHPDLVPIAMAAFDKVLGDKPNQLDRLREDVSIKGPELLDISSIPQVVTEPGLRNNISVSLQYLSAWLGGSGAVAIFNLMEDVATAEIARSQIWQWINNEVVLDNGETITRELVEAIAEEEVAGLREVLTPEDAQRLDQAHALFRMLALGQDYEQFLTLSAYPMLV